jgi:hypothetical protein
VQSRIAIRATELNLQSRLRPGLSHGRRPDGRVCQSCRRVLGCAYPLHILDRRLRNAIPAAAENSGVGPRRTWVFRQEPPRPLTMILRRIWRRSSSAAVALPAVPPSFPPPLLAAICSKYLSALVAARPMLLLRRRIPTATEYFDATVRFTPVHLLHILQARENPRDR